MTRLKSTKSIFRAKLSTTAYLLHKTDRHIGDELHLIKKLHRRALRAKRDETLQALHNEIGSAALALDYHPPKSSNRNELLRKINIYKKHHNFLRYIAIENACVHLCAIYEDAIRRIVLKYYEEDIRRLKSRKESLRNEQIVETLLTGHNIHRILAETIVGNLMYGSTEDWHKALVDMGMDITPSPRIKELFLARNCIVHNDKKASPQLSLLAPEKYKPRKDIRLTISDFKNYSDAVEKSITYIISEYDRLFPINNGTWVGVSYDGTDKLST